MNTHLDSFFSLYAIKKIYLCTKEITMNDQTVICAIATAPGMGAIAVIRLSGKVLPGASGPLSVPGL